MLNRLIVATLILCTLSTTAYCQCVSGAVAWVTPPSPPAGSLQATGKILGTVDVIVRSAGTFAGGRPGYNINSSTWAGYTFSSLFVYRGASFASGTYTSFKLSVPLDSTYMHLRVSDIRGDGFNTEHQRVRGYLNGVLVTASFKDPLNGAFITGGNVINGAAGTTALVQSAMRAFFDGPVDSIVVTSTALSDYIISELMARCDIVLPFTLGSFTARQSGAVVLLDWEASSESGFDHYDVERSIDGTKWNKIGEQRLSVRKSGLAIYHFADLSPLEGKNYYRLKSLEKTGGFTYSKVVAINFKTGSATTEASIYPNPFTESINIKLTDPREKIESIRIFNNQGQVVKNIQTTSGNLPISTQSWPTGIYLVEIRTEKGNRIVQKLVKN